MIGKVKVGALRAHARGISRLVLCIMGLYARPLGFFLMPVETGKIPRVRAYNPFLTVAFMLGSLRWVKKNILSLEPSRFALGRREWGDGPRPHGQGLGMGGGGKAGTGGPILLRFVYPPQVPLTEDWGALMGEGATGFAPAAEKSKKGSDRVIAAAGITERFPAHRP